MKESDFIALNEHLEALRPIFDSFCHLHGFVYVNRRSLGRYPRIRIERGEATKLWFDLWMELDEKGNRYEHFSHDIPYELSAGAYSDIQLGLHSAVRYQKTRSCFIGKPFVKISSILYDSMLENHKIIERWDLQTLKETGIGHVIRMNPRANQ